jgi:DNA processing protein
MTEEDKKSIDKAEIERTGMTRESLIALHETEGVGRLSILTILLYGHFKGEGSLVRIGDFQPKDWQEMGLHPKQASAIVASLQPAAAERRLARNEKLGIRVVTYMDAEYPELLFQISDPPWVIYAIGNWELVHRPALAIVGTRLATAYGRKVAEDLARGCAKRMTIVSGLARGIDSAAHAGAVHAPQGTIAVMAGGVENCYPPENKGLYQDIASQGLILSESPPGTSLHPGLFPLRNRIIAGLCYGVIVVEAAQRSGALITADLATGYHRDVFVVPGPITSPRSRGALEYYRKNARMVLDESDIFKEYQAVLPEISIAPKTIDPKETPRTTDVDLTSDESAIYHFLLEQPCSVDELSLRSGMTFGHLHSVLLSLLIKRRIHQQPVSVYTVI